MTQITNSSRCLPPPGHIAHFRSHFINEPGGTLSPCRETSLPPRGQGSPPLPRKRWNPPNPQTPLCGFFYSRRKQLLPGSTSTCSAHANNHQKPLLHQTGNGAMRHQHSLHRRTIKGPSRKPMHCPTLLERRHGNSDGIDRGRQSVGRWSAGRRIRSTAVGIFRIDLREHRRRHPRLSRTAITRRSQARGRSPTPRCSGE